MKCKKCGFTKRNGMWKTLCWTKFQICGKCARKDHPEIYEPSYVGLEKNFKKGYKPYKIKRN